MVICMGFNFDEILAIRALADGADYRQVNIESNIVMTATANGADSIGEFTEVDLGCSFNGYIPNAKLKALGVKFEQSTFYNEISKIYFALAVELAQINTCLDMLVKLSLNDKLENLGNPFVTVHRNSGTFTIYPIQDGGEWVYCHKFNDALRPFGSRTADLGEHLAKMLPVWWLRENGVIEKNGWVFNIERLEHLATVISRL